MCVSPTYVFLEKGPSFKRTEVPCGWCWSCNKNRVNDLVGRCLLEASTSVWMCALTLTYDDKLSTPEQRRVLQKADLQRFLYRLRKKYKVRYLVAGEYGKKFGRAHFHVVLFGYCPEPPPSFSKRGMVTDYRVWPFGHMFVDNKVNERSIRYIAKYLLKGAKRKKTRFDNRYNREWVSYSRIPIMGEKFVRELAAKYALERVFPRSFKYRPPFAHPRREYQFTGEARFVFLDEVYEKWPQAVDALVPEQMSGVVVAYIKDRARKRWEALTASEREIALTDEIRAVSQVDRRYAHLTARFLYDRMQAEGIDNVETFKEQFAADAAVVEKAFRRNIAVRPPSYAEGFRPHAT